MDSETRKRWEETADKAEISKWSEMQTLLEKRCSALESIETAICSQKASHVHHPKKPLKSFVVLNNSGRFGNKQRDHRCDLEHKMANLNLKERWEFLKSKRLCFNCLSRTNLSRDCPHGSLCYSCPGKLHGKHNILLHNDVKNDQNKDEPEDTSRVVLMTAVVNVYDDAHRPHQARVLLDSGLEANVMTD